MLAGCSSTLLSPRHRLRSEASTQFQACHPMSTQRLDLPCNFPRKDVSVSRPQSSVRPVGLSIDNKRIETKALKQQSVRGREIKTEFWGEKGGKGLKRRFTDDDDQDGEDSSCVGRVKRKKGCFDFEENVEGGLGGNWVQQPDFGGVAGFPQMPYSLTSYTGEEEGVCFVQQTDHPWGESEITEYGGDNDAETSHGPVRETVTTTSGSSSSSDRSLSVGLGRDPTSQRGFGNGSSFPNPGNGTRSILYHNDGQTEQQEFELISLLVGCVEAVVSRNIAAIHHFIAKLGDQASPKSRSTISRLVAYFTEALALRVTRVWPHVFHISVPREFDRFDDDSGASALRLLNQISPIPKFVHFAANEMLLRAFEGKDKVHIIDFDIKQGLQWPGFFQSLALRRNPPSHVRITGIGESKQDLIETGERLAGFAEAFNLPFEFHPVVDRLEDVRLWMLHVKEGESVGINCVFQLHKTLYDPNGGAFRDFMGLIRSTNPVAMFMAEQEADLNEANLEMRVCNSLRYYSAIFDSIDSTLPYDSLSRVKIEEIFGHEIRNVIACEEGDRVERHEKFSKWKRRMEQEGFMSMRVGETELFQSQMLLKMYSSENYSVVAQAEEAITLRWLDEPLYTVSLWVPVNTISGSSSGFSQAT
ncbi:scarecrow-like protein 28 [Silene latifolia]|uniref:scarecrow-like protein 28 n=1 Tax=Silene latifolia TaxID=37657 RepID=UPI003D76EE64